MPRRETHGYVRRSDEGCLKLELLDLFDDVIALSFEAVWLKANSEEFDR
jgi:hypothetical protein